MYKTTCKASFTTSVAFRGPRVHVQLLLLWLQKWKRVVNHVINSLPEVGDICCIPARWRASVHPISSRLLDNSHCQTRPLTQSAAKVRWCGSKGIISPTYGRNSIHLHKQAMTHLLPPFHRIHHPWLTHSLTQRARMLWWINTYIFQVYCDKGITVTVTPDNLEESYCF